MATGERVIEPESSEYAAAIERGHGHASGYLCKPRMEIHYEAAANAGHAYETREVSRVTAVARTRMGMRMWPYVVVR